MSSITPPSSEGGPSKRKADDANGSARDGKKTRVKPQAAPALDEDDEWARFQQEVLSGAQETQAGPTDAATSNATAASPPPPARTSVVYADATIEAQPELRGAAIARSDQASKEEESEAQKRKRLAREENEEIFARLEEEQRLQDEADERVSSLKSRLERIKAARAAKQSSKNKGNGAKAKVSGGLAEDDPSMGAA